jgi:MHS family proline/betaine transporter-like MFS transporter
VKHSHITSGSSEFSRLKKVILSCIAGSALEWYDFAAYSFFTAIIGKLFFPSGDAFQQTIASFGAFAAGLIARPIGAILFGYIGDIYGRKKALEISIYLMAIPTAIMGILPTHDQIGMWAGVTLTLIRILQGLALGGGFTGTMVFLYEHSSDARKSTYSAWAPFSLVSGFILGALVATLMSLVLSAEQLESFGWRIPFILSFVGTFIARYVKNHLEDPHEFMEQQKLDGSKQKQSGTHMLCSLFKLHWKGLLLVTFVDALTACGYFLIAIFLVTYFETFLHLEKTVAFRIQTINMILFAPAILFGGWLADRIGKRLQMCIACVAMIVLAYPLFMLMGEGSFYSVLFGEMGIIFIFSIYYGPIPATICSMLPMRVRLMGVSIAHNFAMAAFGAYASTWATYTIKITSDIASPAWLFMLTAFMTIVALVVWKEGKEY